MLEAVVWDWSASKEAGVADVLHSMNPPVALAAPHPSSRVATLPAHNMNTVHNVVSTHDPKAYQSIMGTSTGGAASEQLVNRAKGMRSEGIDTRSLTNAVQPPSNDYTGMHARGKQIPSEGGIASFMGGYNNPGADTGRATMTPEHAQDLHETVLRQDFNKKHTADMALHQKAQGLGDQVASGIDRAGHAAGQAIGNAAAKGHAAAINDHTPDTRSSEDKIRSFSAQADATPAAVWDHARRPRSVDPRSYTKGMLGAAALAAPLAGAATGMMQPDKREGEDQKAAAVIWTPIAA